VGGVLLRSCCVVGAVLPLLRDRRRRGGVHHARGDRVKDDCQDIRPTTDHQRSHQDQRTRRFTYTDSCAGVFRAPSDLRGLSERRPEDVPGGLDHRMPNRYGPLPQRFNLLVSLLVLSGVTNEVGERTLIPFGRHAESRSGTRTGLPRPSTRSELLGFMFYLGAIASG